MRAMEKPDPQPKAEGQESKETKDEKVVLSKSEYDRLIGKDKELEDVREKLLRTAAEYDNARKRLAKEREEFIKFSQERLIRELLPILDNFERALSHFDESGSGTQVASKALATGIEMILKQLLGVLTHHGLKRFSSEGRPFDPHFHEAIDQVEEEGPEGVVIQEVLPGYSLGERVIRPAKVRIRVTPGKKQGQSGEEKQDEIT